MKSFAYAFRGLLRTVRNQRNMRIHLCFAFFVIEAALVTGVSAAEWALLLICCGAVIGLECVNTAVESLCDEVTTEYSRRIELAKDAAAGGVLAAALFSAAAGSVVFFGQGRPAASLEFFLANPVIAAMQPVLLALWMIFVFRRRKK